MAYKLNFSLSRKKKRADVRIEGRNDGAEDHDDDDDPPSSPLNTMPLLLFSRKDTNSILIIFSVSRFKTF